MGRFPFLEANLQIFSNLALKGSITFISNRQIFLLKSAFIKWQSLGNCFAK
jgi:hypothetical protein